MTNPIDQAADWPSIEEAEHWADKRRGFLGGASKFEVACEAYRQGHWAGWNKARESLVVTAELEKCEHVFEIGDDFLDYCRKCNAPIGAERSFRNFIQSRKQLSEFKAKAISEREALAGKLRKVKAGVEALIATQKDEGLGLMGYHLVGPNTLAILDELLEKS